MLSIAATASPPVWITVVTALGGALVGGVLTAGAQLLGESRRAAHELVLEDKRAEHQERLERSRVDERARQDDVMTRGAARVLSDSLNSSRARFQTWLDQHKVYAHDFMPSLELSSDDRQILAQRLTPEQWYAVSKARSGIELMNTLASSRLAGRSWMELEDVEFDKFLMAGLRGVVVQIAAALSALAGLTDDKDLTTERLQQAAGNGPRSVPEVG